MGPAAVKPAFWLRVVLTPIVLILYAAAAWAQDWAMNQYDDGSFFAGSLSPIDGPGFTLLCGERSPQGLSPRVTGNTEPDISDRNAFLVYLSAQDIGAPGAIEAGRNDVLVVIGTTGYRLPQVTWNELFGTWQTTIGAGDPMFAAIAQVPRFELRSDRNSHFVSSQGFATGFNDLLGYCQAMFSAVGMPWAGAAPGQQSMRQAAQARIISGCNGAVAGQDDPFLVGDVDGDGVEDVLLRWRAVQCAGRMPRPYCGASQCSADLFLSSQYARRGKPEYLLGLGMRLFPLTNGRMGIGVGGGLGDCRRNFGRDDCEYQYYWNGSKLARMN